MATEPITCGHCGRAVGAEVITSSGHVVWLHCPACGEGSTRNNTTGIIYPNPRPRRALASLPADVERAWNEARSAHSVGAYTAAEMICRKILMHLAVDKAGAQAGRQFAQYVDDLENAGYITAGLKPVVDQVRQRGNVANHELPASTMQDSLTTIKITEHLLEAMYELPGMGTPVLAPSPAGPTSATGQSSVT
jgi:uncharacterized protein DUF4145